MDSIIRFLCQIIYAKISVTAQPFRVISLDRYILRMRNVWPTIHHDFANLPNKKKLLFLCNSDNVGHFRKFQSSPSEISQKLFTAMKVVGCFGQCTLPRPSEISERNWSTYAKSFLESHLWYTAMLKVWKKFWEPFSIYQLAML